MTKYLSKNQNSVFCILLVGVKLFSTMTVYIEYVFASNFVFDFVLLYFTNKICKLNVGKLRLFLADIFGTLVAIFLPVLNLGYALSVLCKLALSFGIIFVFGGYKTKKGLLCVLFVFWCLTFGMGGVLVGIYFVLGQDFVLQQDLSFVSLNSLPTFVGGLFVFIFFAKGFVGYLKTKKINSKFEHKVEVVVDGKSFVFNGFLDSGNQLCECDLPVVVALSKQAKNFFAKQISQSVVGGGIAKDVHYIPFGTLDGTNKKILVFGLDCFFVDGKQVDVLVGISQVDATFDGYDLLLNAKMDI